MAVVHIPTSLRSLCRGAEVVDVDAADVRELIAELERRFPGVAKRLETDVAVAIDGEIYPDPLLEALEPGSDVHFLPAISGGAG